jgi:hypothetical protein
MLETVSTSRPKIEKVGSHLILPTATGALPEVSMDIEGLVTAVWETKFDFDTTVAMPKPVLEFWAEGKKWPVAGRGMIGGIIGPKKAGKSFVTAALAEAFITGKERLNFEFGLSGKGIWFDTEQSVDFYHAVQKRIHEGAGLRGNSKKYTAVLLRRWSPQERIVAMDHIIRTTKELEFVVIDGLADLLSNTNDIGQASSVINMVMKWTMELGLLVIGIIHTNKGDGKIRGHLGSEFERKCDFAIEISQPSRNRYKLWNPYGRFMTFPPMEFTRDFNTESGRAIYDDGRSTEIPSDFEY